MRFLPFAAVTAFNGAFAGLCAGLVTRDLLHRHWILPSLAAFLSYQWVFGALTPWGRREAAGPWRDAVLSLLAFTTALGLVVYPGMLSCPESCAFKSACAALLAALVFWNQSLVREDRFWDGLRARLAALGCLLWGLYLLLYGRHLTFWVLDLVFFIVALGLWLGRSRAVLLIASVGIVVLAAVRSADNELLIVLLDLALLTGLFLGGGRWVERRLARDGRPESRGSPLAVVAAGALFIVLAVYAAQPAWLMVSPERRRAALEALAPSFPVQDPATLSPLAARLHAHVRALAGDIGERSAYQPDRQGRARDYIVGRLREAGYAPDVQPFAAERGTDFIRREPYDNVEARLKGRDDGRGVWVVGAHYDSAPGTPGADDNASGVAVLLEAARLLQGRGLKAPEVRFAAFAAEEPPAFGTRDMGSLRYARALKDRGVKVRGMVNLEMVGYFNPRRGAQLFPPFMRPFYPDRGDFIGLAGNLRSVRLRRELTRAWPADAKVPLIPALLPSVFSVLAISDQLNFWYAGFPALMLSDSAFFRNPHYHQESDTPEKLDYERMAALTEALVGVLGR
ncbi:MAG: M28 family peptidase [Elusimicrobiota bacterium]|jgi:hypothetical protein